MNLKCPVCSHSNVFLEIVVPYYICNKCRFGQTQYDNYRFDRGDDIEKYHLDFWTAVKKIEDEKEIKKMISGVLD